MKLTKRGQNILAKALAESFEIKFVAFKIGSGNLAEGDDPFEFTELKNFQMDLPLTELKVVGNGLAEITANLNNATVERGFCCREHGLYCLDENGEEVLYSYRNLAERYDFIPSFSGGAVKNIFLTEEVEIQDAENVTAIIDYSVAYISTQDFKAHVDSEHPHPNIPNHYNDIETTSEIWATDSGDNNLHLIKIENLREVLKNDEGEKISMQDKISAAQNELGLNSNLLMIEDFGGGDVVTDYFKSKVTSYAEHGNFLGIATPENLRTGGNYILSDGVFSESVDVIAVIKNDSGYYAKLENPVANTFNTANLFLYRTTPAPCDKNSVTWNGATFKGIRANISRTLELENFFTIQGDGFFDGEFLTLA